MILRFHGHAPLTRGGVPVRAGWRTSGIGLLRIVFGLIWAVDAYFKWLPDFRNNLDDYLTGALKDQPAAVHAWIGFWVNTVGVNPHAFGYAVAAAETAVALGLILGLLSNLTNIGGTLLSLVIWSTAEGLGGPYKAGSTDVGAAIIYALVFAGLFLASAGLYVGLDRWLTPVLGRFGVLASGPLEVSRDAVSHDTLSGEQGRQRDDVVLPAGVRPG